MPDERETWKDNVFHLGYRKGELLDNDRPEKFTNWERRYPGNLSLLLWERLVPITILLY